MTDEDLVAALARDIAYRRAAIHLEARAAALGGKP